MFADWLSVFVLVMIRSLLLERCCQVSFALFICWVVWCGFFAGYCLLVLYFEIVFVWLYCDLLFVYWFAWLQAFWWLSLFCLLI